MKGKCRIGLAVGGALVGPDLAGTAMPASLMLIVRRHYVLHGSDRHTLSPHGPS
jgi:hypothetical protein